jgi:hypothetical protein
MRPTHEASSDALARVTVLEPDRARAEAVRLRCRAQLAARRPVDRGRIDARGSLAGAFVPMLLGAFSIVYAVSLVEATLRIAGWLG